MTLEELKAYMGYVEPLDEAERVKADALLAVRLETAIDIVKGALNRYFDDEPMPLRVKALIAAYVEEEQAASLVGNVKSESIGGMSQTFATAEERTAAFEQRLLDTRLRKLVW